MPLARYFFFVGGALLALLLVLNEALPQPPLAESSDAGAAKPVVRIASDRKWPERIVFDTSIPSIVPVKTATNEQPVAMAVPAPVTEVSAKARDAFAQLEPSDPQNRKLHHKRRVARKQSAPPMMLVAQQPHVGFFARSIW